jgi:hypothetical protein
VSVVDGTAFVGFSWMFVVCALRLNHLETAVTTAARHASPPITTPTIALVPSKALYMPGKTLELNAEYHSLGTTGGA